MAANPIDLCVLEDVKTYLGIKLSETGDDVTIQSLITGASQYWLTRTTRGSLNSVVTYNERYDGRGKEVLMVRYYPIVSILSLTVDGVAISQSTDYVTPGWVIDTPKDMIILVGRSFCYGRQNIGVNYTAGFSTVPFDVNDAVIKQVAQNFRRRKTIDQASLALPEGGGMTRWRDWAVPPDVEQIIQAYRPGVPV